MGISDKLFAHGLALGDEAQHRIYGDRKRELFSEVEGTVVEIGPGTGVNLRYLPDGITWIGMEPNPHMHSYLWKKLTGRSIEATLRTEAVPSSSLATNTADFVISTLVLCSVADLDETLADLKRILGPGGQLLFIEHVAASHESWLYTLQHNIQPLWRRIADGCHPDRETGTALESAGFSSVEYERFTTGLPVVSPHIMGRTVV